MSLLNIPYPKTSFSKFIRFLGVLSGVISFILIVFQPFGTSSFVHPFKFWILLGYGIIIFLAGSGFYKLADLFLTEDIKDKWTIWLEVTFLFCTIV
ncbi:MAG TPA: hypothetical protein PKD85_06385, partial [Saprospiraceae bacterium]|nr:hypothetical protein [Saprospiraceae bacterium]